MAGVEVALGEHCQDLAALQEYKKDALEILADADEYLLITAKAGVLITRTHFKRPLIFLGGMELTKQNIMGQLGGCKMNPLNIEPYDPVSDTIVIEGTRYSADFFRNLGCSFPAMIGQVLRIDKKEDGVVTVTRLKEREGDDKIAELYHDLLYCVSKKFPDETRHETAKRYLLERERQSSGEGRCDTTFPNLMKAGE